MSSINSKVPPPRLSAVDTPTDGQIPSYQASSGEFEWVDDSGGAPGGSADEIQYNDGAGAFAGDAGFKMQTKGGGSSTKIRVGDILIGSSTDALVQATQNGSLRLSPEGSGQLTISSNNDAGGTMTDMQVNITAQTASDDPILQFGNLSAHTGELRLDGGTGDFIVTAEGADKDLDLKVNGTGQVEVQNTTTDNDTTFSVKGNGTGNPIISMSNDTKAVELKCTTNQKLDIRGGTNEFVLDVSSSSGGITFPDGTTQNTAASGGDSYGSLADPTEMNSASLKFNTNQRVGGGTYSGTPVFEYSGGPKLYPFVSPHTGTVVDMTIEVTSTASGRSVDVGIYSTDSATGLPDSLIAKANISAAVAGQITQTSFTGTPSLTKGVLYWIGQHSDGTTFGGAGKGRENNPANNAPSNIVCGLESGDYFGNSLPNCIKVDGQTSLPSTITATDCKGENRDLLDVVLGW